jgi:hypothetical protein
MYQCKYLNMLPLQSNHDFATVEGDTVLIPEQRFEQLFGDKVGGVLGIRVRCGSALLYGGCAPQVDDEYAIYLPDWMMAILHEKTLNFDDLSADIELAGDMPNAASLIVRRVDDDLEADVQELLQQFLYDCKFIQPNTMLHLPFAGTTIDVIVDKVLSADGSELPVGRLGDEVVVEFEAALISDAYSVEFPTPPAPPIALPIRGLYDGLLPPLNSGVFIPYESIPVAMPIMMPDAATLRAQRLAYYSTLAGDPTNIAYGAGQQGGSNQ